MGHILWFVFVFFLGLVLGYAFRGKEHAEIVSAGKGIQSSLDQEIGKVASGVQSQVKKI